MTKIESVRHQLVAATDPQDIARLQDFMRRLEDQIARRAARRTNHPFQLEVMQLTGVSIGPDGKFGLQGTAKWECGLCGMHRNKHP